MMMADSFITATLLPAAAMRPRRPAEPVREVRMEENVSDCDGVRLCQPDRRHRGYDLMVAGRKKDGVRINIRCCR